MPAQQKENSHVFNSDTGTCQMCDMSREHYEANGKPFCKGVTRGVNRSYSVGFSGGDHDAESYSISHGTTYGVTKKRSDD